MTSMYQTLSSLSETQRERLFENCRETICLRQWFKDIEEEPNETQIDKCLDKIFYFLYTINNRRLLSHLIEKYVLFNVIRSERVRDAFYRRPGYWQFQMLRLLQHDIMNADTLGTYLSFLNVNSRNIALHTACTSNTPFADILSQVSARVIDGSIEVDEQSRVEVQTLLGKEDDEYSRIFSSPGPVSSMYGSSPFNQCASPSNANRHFSPVNGGSDVVPSSPRSPTSPRSAARKVPVVALEPIRKFSEVYWSLERQIVSHVVSLMTILHYRQLYYLCSEKTYSSFDTAQKAARDWVDQTLEATCIAVEELFGWEEMSVSIVRLCVYSLISMLSNRSEDMSRLSDQHMFFSLCIQYTGSFIEDFIFTRPIGSSTPLRRAKLAHITISPNANHTFNPHKPVHGIDVLFGAENSEDVRTLLNYIYESLRNTVAPSMDPHNGLPSVVNYLNNNRDLSKEVSHALASLHSEEHPRLLPPAFLKSLPHSMHEYLRGQSTNPFSQPFTKELFALHLDANGCQDTVLLERYTHLILRLGWCSSDLPGLDMHLSSTADGLYPNSHNTAMYGGEQVKFEANFNIDVNVQMNINVNTILTSALTNGHHITTNPTRSSSVIPSSSSAVTSSVASPSEISTPISSKIAPALLQAAAANPRASLTIARASCSTNTPMTVSAAAYENAMKTNRMSISVSAAHARRSMSVAPVNGRSRMNDDVIDEHDEYVSPSPAMSMKSRNPDAIMQQLSQRNLLTKTNSTSMFFKMNDQGDNAHRGSVNIASIPSKHNVISEEDTSDSDSDHRDGIMGRCHIRVPGESDDPPIESDDPPIERGRFSDHRDLKGKKSKDDSDKKGLLDVDGKKSVQLSIPASHVAHNPTVVNDIGTPGLNFVVQPEDRDTSRKTNDEDTSYKGIYSDHYVHQESESDSDSDPDYLTKINARKSISFGAASLLLGRRESSRSLNSSAGDKREVYSDSSDSDSDPDSDDSDSNHRSSFAARAYRRPSIVMNPDIGLNLLKVHDDHAEFREDEDDEDAPVPVANPAVEPLGSPVPGSPGPFGTSVFNLSIHPPEPPHPETNTDSANKKSVRPIRPIQDHVFTEPPKLPAHQPSLSFTPASIPTYVPHATSPPIPPKHAYFDFHNFHEKSGSKKYRKFRENLHMDGQYFSLLCSFLRQLFSLPHLPSTTSQYPYDCLAGKRSGYHLQPKKQYMAVNEEVLNANSHSYSSIQTRAAMQTNEYLSKVRAERIEVDVNSMYSYVNSSDSNNPIHRTSSDDTTEAKPDSPPHFFNPNVNTPNSAQLPASSPYSLTSPPNAGYPNSPYTLHNSPIPSSLSPPLQVDDRRGSISALAVNRRTSLSAANPYHPPFAQGHPHTNVKSPLGESQDPHLEGDSEVPSVSRPSKSFIVDSSNPFAKVVNSTHMPVSLNNSSTAIDISTSPFARYLPNIPTVLSNTHIPNGALYSHGMPVNAGASNISELNHMTQHTHVYHNHDGHGRPISVAQEEENKRFDNAMANVKDVFDKVCVAMKKRPRFSYFEKPELTFLFNEQLRGMLQKRRANYAFNSGLISQELLQSSDAGWRRDTAPQCIYQPVWGPLLYPAHTMPVTINSSDVLYNHGIWLKTNVDSQIVVDGVDANVEKYYDKNVLAQIHDNMNVGTVGKGMLMPILTNSMARLDEKNIVGRRVQEVFGNLPSHVLESLRKQHEIVSDNLIHTYGAFLSLNNLDEKPYRTHNRDVAMTMFMDVERDKIEREKRLLDEQMHDIETQKRQLNVAKAEFERERQEHLNRLAVQPLPEPSPYTSPAHESSDSYQTHHNHSPHVAETNDHSGTIKSPIIPLPPPPNSASNSTSTSTPVVGTPGSPSFNSILSPSPSVNDTPVEKRHRRASLFGNPAAEATISSAVPNLSGEIDDDINAKRSRVTSDRVKRNVNLRKIESKYGTMKRTTAAPVAPVVPVAPENSTRSLDLASRPPPLPNTSQSNAQLPPPPPRPIVRTMKYNAMPPAPTNDPPPPPFVSRANTVPNFNLVSRNNPPNPPNPPPTINPQAAQTKTYRRESIITRGFNKLFRKTPRAEDTNHDDEHHETDKCCSLSDSHHSNLHETSCRFYTPSSAITGSKKFNTFDSKLSTQSSYVTEVAVMEIGIDDLTLDTGTDSLYSQTPSNTRSNRKRASKTFVVATPYDNGPDDSRPEGSVNIRESINQTRNSMNQTRLSYCNSYNHNNVAKGRPSYDSRSSKILPPPIYLQTDSHSNDYHTVSGNLDSSGSISKPPHRHPPPIDKEAYPYNSLPIGRIPSEHRSEHHRMPSKSSDADISAMFRDSGRDSTGSLDMAHYYFSNSPVPPEAPSEPAPLNPRNTQIRNSNDESRMLDLASSPPNYPPPIPQRTNSRLDL